MKVTCQYCKELAVMVSGERIYRNKNYIHRRFWLCEGCDAYVGTHKDGTPLGTLANRTLRYHRKLAHEAFDMIWKGTDKIMTRSKAYSWLARKMRRKKIDAHIGMFNVPECKEVVQLSLIEIGKSKQRKRDET